MVVRVFGTHKSPSAVRGCRERATGSVPGTSAATTGRTRKKKKNKNKK